MRYLTLLCAALLALGAHAEDIYKWVDKDGKVHYGDRPKDTQADRVTIDRPGYDPQPVTEAEAAAAAARKAACDEKTKNYERYKSADVIKQTDAFGETREFSAEERQRFLELAKSQMSEACSAPAPVAAAADEQAGGD